MTWLPPISDEETWEIINDAAEHAGVPVDGPRRIEAIVYSSIPEVIHRARRRWLDSLVERGIVPEAIRDSLDPEPAMPGFSLNPSHYLAKP